MRLCLQAALPKAVGAEELGLRKAQGTADDEEEEVGARGGGQRGTTEVSRSRPASVMLPRHRHRPTMSCMAVSTLVLHGGLHPCEAWASRGAAGHEWFGMECFIFLASFNYTCPGATLLS